MTPIKRPARRPWTPDEVQYLFDHCGLISNKVLAERLNRSQHAVRCRLQRNGISIFSNFYTARLLGKELGRDKETVMQWYRKGWLTGRVSDWGRGYLRSPMVFRETSIVIFLKKYHYRFDWKKIPNPYFRNVVMRESLRTGLRQHVESR